MTRQSSSSSFVMELVKKKSPAQYKKEKQYGARKKKEKNVNLI